MQKRRQKAGNRQRYWIIPRKVFKVQQGSYTDEFMKALTVGTGQTYIGSTQTKFQHREGEVDTKSHP